MRGETRPITWIHSSKTGIPVSSLPVFKMGGPSSSFQLLLQVCVTSNCLLLEPSTFRNLLARYDGCCSLLLQFQRDSPVQCRPLFIPNKLSTNKNPKRRIRPFVMAHIVSCRFLRLRCSEEDHPLFRREYARNNRERGVKLLRCFPHCCPDHARRSYCGCSVHVLVNFSDAMTVPPDNIIVCARFEPIRVSPLWPAGLADLARTVGATEGRQGKKCKFDIGESLKLPECLFGSAARASSGDGEWVLAEKESEANQRAIPQNSVLYVLNNRVSPKWFYSYDSSVTRTQREMTHHLVAYVFQVLPRCNTMTQQQYQVQQQVPERHNVIVLARHASPGFLLVSYRRSGGAAVNPGCPFPAIETPDDSMEVTSSQIMSASWIVHEDQQQHLQEQQWLQQQRLQQRLQSQHKERQQHEWRRQDFSPHLAQGIPSIHASVSAIREAESKADRDDKVHDNQTRAADLITPKDAAEDVDLWQHDAEASAPGFREKGQQLLILWYFLEHISLRDFGVNADTIEANLRASSLVSDTQLESVVASCLSNVLASPSLESTPYSIGQEQATLRVCGYIFLRALSSRAVQQLFRVAFQVGSGDMDKRSRFATLISELWHVLGDVLQEVNRLCPHQAATLPALVDDVMSVVYSQSRFGELRTKISALLLDRETPSSLTGAVNRVFRVFSAQVDESIIAPQIQHPHTLGTRAGGLLLSQWCRRWLLEPGSLQIMDITSGANYTASLVLLSHFIREFGCIDVNVTQNVACCLSLRAAFSLSAGLTAPMELVLDGRTREFRALPSGLSSKIAVAGQWAVHDYSATLSQDGNSIDIHLFAYGTDSTHTEEDIASGVGSTTRMRRVSLSLVLEQELVPDEPMDDTQAKDLFIIVQGTVCGSTYYRSRERSRSRDAKISDMTSSDRVVVWNASEWIPLLELHAGYVAL